MCFKFKTFLAVLALAIAIPFQVMAQPADCTACLEEPIEPVCILDDDGTIHPFPNACFAECIGFSLDNQVECDSFIIITDDPTGEWDCVECLDEEFEPVCVDDGTGNIIPFPNACFAECEGFSSDDFVECDSTILGGGCDPPTGEWDCEECLDEPFDPVCVLDSLGSTLFFPNSCTAECVGYTSEDFVDCGIVNDDPFLACLDCLDDPGEPVCVTDEEGNQIPMPNACFAECLGYSPDDFVECDSTIFDGNGNCDPPIGGSEDCVECWDSEIDPVCVADDEGFVIPFPNACFAECAGFTADDFVECDSTIFGGGNCDPPVGEDCVECLDEPIDPVCVFDSLGFVTFFPNACYAECAGFTADDFADCDNNDNPLLACLECLSEPVDPVCIDDAGEILELPNFCFAECLGFTAADLISCDSLTGGSNNASVKIHDHAESFEMDQHKFNLQQNPVGDVARITYDATTPSTPGAVLVVLDLNGRVLVQQTVQVSTGMNNYEIDTHALQPGLYQLNIQTTDNLETLKFVKQR